MFHTAGRNNLQFIAADLADSPIEHGSHTAILGIGSGVAAETARTFAETLAHTPRVSILQGVKQPGDGTVQKRDFTLLQNGQQTWLAVVAAEPGAPLRVKTTSGAEIRALLAEWV